MADNDQSSSLSGAILCSPIGFVRSSIREPVDDCWAGVISYVELDSSKFAEDATRGLADFSHVEVLFLFDRVAPESVLTGSRHPRNNPAWPRVGIFAQRGKARPNRIGVTVCQLDRVEGTRIWVRELDAIDGTPVLDIKPYMQEFAPRSPIRQPAWSHELMAAYFKPKQ